MCTLGCAPVARPESRGRRVDVACREDERGPGVRRVIEVDPVGRGRGRRVVLAHACEDLDVLSAEPAAAQLGGLAANGGYDLVVIDVTGRFVAVAGIRVLAQAAALAAQRGRQWAIAGVRPPRLARLAAFWYPEVVWRSTVPAAVAALQDGAGR